MRCRPDFQFCTRRSRVTQTFNFSSLCDCILYYKVICIINKEIFAKSSPFGYAALQTERTRSSRPSWGGRGVLPPFDPRKQYLFHRALYARVALRWWCGPCCWRKGWIGLRVEGRTLASRTGPNVGIGDRMKSVRGRPRRYMIVVGCFPPAKVIQNSTFLYIQIVGEACCGWTVRL